MKEHDTADIVEIDRKLSAVLSEGGGTREKPFGFVSGVYRQVINVQSRESQRFFSLLASGAGEEPWSLRAQLPAFTELDIKPGDPVWCQGGWFTAGSCRFRLAHPDVKVYSIAPLEGSIKDKKRFQNSLDQLRRLMAEADEAAAGDERQGYLGAHMGCEELLNCLYSQVVAAVGGGDKESAAESAKRLMGLGPGLTPSGDDWLAGFLAGLRIEEHPFRSWGDMLQAVIHREAKRTTELSAEFLKRACEGVFSSKVRRVILAACQGEDTAAGLKALLQTGSTSGLDTARGILAGLTMSVKKNNVES